LHIITVAPAGKASKKDTTLLENTSPAKKAALKRGNPNKTSDNMYNLFN